MSDCTAGQLPCDKWKLFLTVEFEFKRMFMTVFFTTYLPAIVMVILGGLATFMDPKSSPARVTLAICLTLTISTVIQGMKSMLPQVNYLTALDVYLWTCFFFVCVTLVEYIYLNYITVVRPMYHGIEFSTCDPRKNYEDTHPLVKNTDSDNSTEISMESSTENSGETLIAPRIAKVMTNWRASSYNNRLTVKIDGRFRIIYFSVFVVFNTFYWVYYICRATHKTEQSLTN